MELINYKKPKNTLANISINLFKNKDFIRINNLDYKEDKNFISVEEIKLEGKKILSFKQINVQTMNNGKTNNNFSIIFNQKDIFERRCI